MVPHHPGRYRSAVLLLSGICQLPQTARVSKRLNLENPGQSVISSRHLARLTGWSSELALSGLPLVQTLTLELNCELNALGAIMAGNFGSTFLYGAIGFVLVFLVLAIIFTCAKWVLFGFTQSRA